jgi:ADP-ribose pyrophosphatase YjhB (NUDIX family)
MPMQTRVLARVVAYDPDAEKILLVRNKGADYWYAPGGGWECERETIEQCAVREVREEAGLAVRLKRLLYLQEFHAKEDLIFFETFWLAVPERTSTLHAGHPDADPQG